MVNFNNVPPAASIIKTATGALVTYSVQVCNDSDAEAVTLNELIDEPMAILLPQMITLRKRSAWYHSCSIPPVRLEIVTAVPLRQRPAHHR
jgi:hypothetical protein